MSVFKEGGHVTNDEVWVDAEIYKEVIAVSRFFLVRQLAPCPIKY